MSDLALAVIMLGRARPGFDQQWSARIVSRCGDFLARRYGARIEPRVAKSGGELRAMLVSQPVRRADVVLFLQPSIADGVLINTIAQHASDKALLFWATPERPEGNIVSSNSLVGTHLFVATLVQYGLTPAFVCGDPDSAALQREIHREIQVLAAVAATRRARIGLIGAHAPGFVDLHVDPRHLSRHTGATLEHISMHQFFEQVDGVDEQQLRAYLERLRARALPMRDIPPRDVPARDAPTRDIPTRDIPAADAESMLRVQARYWAAYRELLAANDWDAVALRCWPDVPQRYGHWPYLAVSMLLSEGHAVAIEGDVDAALATYVAYRLAPGGVYLSDWLSHADNSVVLWHGGAIDPALCVPERDSPYRAHIAPHFNSKTPAVIEGDIRYDMEVTLWRIWQSKGRYYGAAIEGRTAVPKQHFRGTTALVTCGADTGKWLEHKMRYGMPHHILMVSGHVYEELRRYAYYMGWEWVV